MIKQKKWIVYLLCTMLAVAFTGCSSENNPNSTPSSIDSSIVEEQSPEEPYHVDFRLTTGHHIAGIDFPAGTYNIRAIEWRGTVTSSNGAINADMGTIDYNTDGRNTYTQEVDAVELPYGTRISLSGGVRLRLTCDDADPTPLESRNQEITEQIALSAGTYIAGQDFPAGMYDFTSTYGVGNVESSNMHDGGISEVMGTTWRIAEGFDYCDQNCQNVELPEGTELRISGVELLLIPSE